MLINTKFFSQKAPIWMDSRYTTQAKLKSFRHKMYLSAESTYESTHTFELSQLYATQCKTHQYNYRKKTKSTLGCLISACHINADLVFTGKTARAANARGKPTRCATTNGCLCVRGLVSRPTRREILQDSTRGMSVSRGRRQACPYTRLDRFHLKSMDFMFIIWYVIWRMVEWSSRASCELLSAVARDFICGICWKISLPF